MLIEKNHWTHDRIGNLTMRQLRISLMKEGEVNQIGVMPTTKAGMKFIGTTIDEAAANLIAGQRWDGNHGT